MEAEELAAILRKMYSDARPKESAVMIHLFGVKYATQIRASGTSPKNIATLAGLPESYGTEINKGINLSRYVREK
jgi:hypothetical protein